jgi:hypothetical protein
MDTKKSKERKALSEYYVELETSLKDNGFKWDSSFNKPRFSSTKYKRGTLVVQLIWEHPEE